MGKFIDTTYSKAVESIQSGILKRLDNSFYRFNGKSPTVVTYYNINTKETELDESTKMSYSYRNADSPIKYNKINNAILYGIDRIQVNLDAGDYGIEADGIEGDAYILPHAFKPFPQDYFYVDHLQDRIFFKVLSVSLDTLPNGNNMYRITYRASSTSDSSFEDMENLVVDEFTMQLSNLGTNEIYLVKTGDFDVINSLDEACRNMKAYYRSMFYSSKVQSFIFIYDEKNFYDPYMVEFIKRNQIINHPDLDFLDVSHQMYMPETFALDYSRTMFHALETKDICCIPNPSLHGMLIEDVTSLMSCMSERYYYVMHHYLPGAYFPIEGYDDDIEARIKANERYEQYQKCFYKNIIIDYFNNNPLDTCLLDLYKDFDLNIPPNKLFYYVPAAIYIYERIAASMVNNLRNK